MKLRYGPLLKQRAIADRTPNKSNYIPGKFVNIWLTQFIGRSVMKKAFLNDV